MTYKTSPSFDSETGRLTSRSTTLRLLFGTDRRVELAYKRTLMASLVCMVWTLIAWFVYLLGNVSQVGFESIALFNVGGVMIFNVAIRSGWSLRFEDVGLTRAQMVFATLCMCGIYVHIPQMRAAALQTMCLTLVFGTFSLTAAQSVRMGLLLALCPLSAAVLLAVMKGGAYSLSSDGMPAVGAAFIMVVMSRLLSHFCKLRGALRAQRNQLQSLAAEAEQLAMTDELTGLYNRRRGTELAELALARHARSGTPICLSMLDIDHFKRVNDQRGHHIGDEVLSGVAAVLTQALRTTDVLIRWGGEEFLLLLPDSSVHDAKMVLDRIQEKMRSCEVSPTYPDLRVSFSAGIAAWDGQETLSELLERGDQAMYGAKANGRAQSALA
ncbi:MAG: GGDEF domain-containing protein [Aquabacterium sp.]|uniref:GGDEF domain-containing protein n=1 Tax=Aquabacterium sp. TaxID=1872578 RepID=UPI0025C08FDE|nr:GGDEF domain-containing protein [Aquabacterium sp.]MBI5925179.1 GGDEF domain-containing protein [Aquabacterium sp.]